MERINSNRRNSATVTRRRLLTTAAALALAPAAAVLAAEQERKRLEQHETGVLAQVLRVYEAYDANDEELGKVIRQLTPEECQAIQKIDWIRRGNAPGAFTVGLPSGRRVLSLPKDYKSLDILTALRTYARGEWVRWV